MPLQMPPRARLRACAPARVHEPAHVREARGGALGGLWRVFLDAMKKTQCVWAGGQGHEQA